jgi:DNA mismatch repair protein MSH4
MLKSFVQAISPLYQALGGAESTLLTMIKENCRPELINPTIQLITEVINEDVTYQKTPLDLRNQRTYAVKVSHIMRYLKQT